MEKNEVALNNQYEDVELAPYEHHTKYYETDQMGTIHQTNYIKWLEDARMDIMEQMGLGYKQMEGLQIMCPLLSVSINYVGAFRFDETVVIETKVTQYDGRKMVLEYSLFDKDTKELKATAKSAHCFMNLSGIPISLNRIYPELETRFFDFK
ncbi:MAG: acyl-CoA thioesterase [Lachnospiraceae bacterium]|nr:acyl-CoA thioesterase [Lachnospiraceae bacterium]